MTAALRQDELGSLPSRRRAPPTPKLLPVLFLPGLLCDQHLWRAQIDALADVAAPIVADLTLDDSINAMAKRALAAAPHRFDLVALSMGGYVALEIMRIAPSRVRSLALIDTSARSDTPERAAARRVGMASLKRGRFVGITHRLMAELVHPDHANDAVGDTLRAMAVRVGGAAFLRQQQAILDRSDARSLLPMIKVPTLVAVGDSDRITPRVDAEELASAIPDAKLAIIADCGHLPALERAQETSLLLRTWLLSRRDRERVVPQHA